MKINPLLFLSPAEIAVLPVFNPGYRFEQRTFMTCEIAVVRGLFHAVFIDDQQQRIAAVKYQLELDIRSSFF